MAENKKDQLAEENKLLKEQLELLKQEENAFASISGLISGNLVELGKTNDTRNLAISKARSLRSISDKLLSNDKEGNALSIKELKNIIDKAKENKNILDNLIEEKKLKQELNENELKSFNDIIIKSKALIELAEERLKIEQEINEAGGLFVNTLKGVEGLLKKLGFSNLAEKLNIKQAIQDAVIFDIKTKKAGVDISQVFKNIGRNIKSSISPLDALILSLKLTVDVAKELDTRITNIRKEFGLTRGEAGRLNYEFTNTFGDLAANVENILKANETLNKGLGGTAIIFDEEIRESAAATQYRLKLSEEAIANMGKLALATGKSFSQIELTQAKSALTAEREFGVRLKLKNILEESNTITGQLRINAERIPGGLSKAVAVARSLGTEFKTMAESANALLDFESSIEKELQAELLIGRDLNLERARLLALNGDIEGVTRELVAQAGSLEALQSMNVIQQQALAGALNLSADQLSDMLMNQKSLNAAAQEGLDRDAQKVLENEKALSVQESLNLMMQKFNDILKVGLALLVGITAALAVLAFPALAIGGLGASGTAFLAGGALGLGTLGAQYIGDGIAPPSKGPFTITDNYGATAITSRGDGIAVSPNISQGTDNTEAKRTNQLLERLLNQPAVFQIGTDEFFTKTAKYSYQIQ